MAYVQMTKLNTAVLDPSAEGTFEKTEELSSAGPGAWIILPKHKKVSVTLQITGGSGYIQATDSPIDDIIANTAVPITSDAGTVVSSYGERIKGANAVRQYNVSGTTKILAISEAIE